MTRWAVFADVRAHQPLPESVVDALEEFRPDDEDLCIWGDERDTALLNVTTEVEADEVATALSVGRELALEVLAFVDFDGHLERVEAEHLAHSGPLGDTGRRRSRGNVCKPHAWSAFPRERLGRAPDLTH